MDAKHISVLDIKAFIDNEGFNNIDKSIDAIKEDMRNNEFNLFTISTSTSHLENFHSDVISILLDPEGVHRQKEKFLHKFIDFLNARNFQMFSSRIVNIEPFKKEKGINMGAIMGLSFVFLITSMTEPYIIRWMLSLSKGQQGSFFGPPMIKRGNILLKTN